MILSCPFRTFNVSPEAIRLTEMMYVRFPLSLRNVEDFLFERGADISHETVRFRWNRFRPQKEAAGEAEGRHGSQGLTRSEESVKDRAKSDGLTIAKLR